MAPININTADPKALATIPGVGSARLKSVITLRAELHDQGKALTYDELVQANILPTETLDKLLRQETICFEEGAGISGNATTVEVQGHDGEHGELPQGMLLMMKQMEDYMRGMLQQVSTKIDNIADRQTGMQVQIDRMELKASPQRSVVSSVSSTVPTVTAPMSASATVASSTDQAMAATTISAGLANALSSDPGYMYNANMLQSMGGMAPQGVYTREGGLKVAETNIRLPPALTRIASLVSASQLPSLGVGHVSGAPLTVTSGSLPAYVSTSAVSGGTVQTRNGPVPQVPPGFSVPTYSHTVPPGFSVPTYSGAGSYPSGYVPPYWQGLNMPGPNVHMGPHQPPPVYQMAQVPPAVIPPAPLYLGPQDLQAAVSLMQRQVQPAYVPPIGVTPLERARPPSPHRRGPNDEDQDHGDEDRGRGRERQGPRGVPRRPYDQDRRRGAEPAPPKLATYDGKQDWRAFFLQFERMSNRYGWDPADRVDRLTDCLRGKALDFYGSLELIVREDFDRLTRKMDARFGRKDPPASLRRQLSALKQKGEESLEEFAERAQKLAADSFPDANGEATEILKTMAMEAFLRGCAHQQAALQVLNKEPPDLGTALHLMKIHEQNYDIMVGPKKPAVRAVYFEDEVKEYLVRATASPGTQDKSRSLEEKVITWIQKPVASAVKSGMEEAMKSMTNMFKEFMDRSTKKDISRPVPNGTPPRPGPNGTPPRERGACYKCGAQSHFARECPRAGPNGTPPRERGACYKCGAMSHFARECQSPSRTPSPQRYPRGSPGKGPKE